MKIPIAAPPEAGKAVIGEGGIVGIILAPGQMAAATGEGFFVDGNPVMSVGDVYVRPVTDVQKNGEVMAFFPSGELAMRQPGELPEGAMLIDDCLWGSDAKAGELALLHCGLRMRAAMAQARARALDLGDDEALPDWHPV